MSSHVSIPQLGSDRATKRSVSLATSLVEDVERRIGRTGFSAVVAEALEQWLAMAKLREVIAMDEEEYGPVSAEALRRAEAEWSAKG